MPEPLHPRDRDRELVVPGLVREVHPGRRAERPSGSARSTARRRCKTRSGSPSTTRLRAGLDRITDGEMQRVDFNLGFYAYLEGIEPLPTARLLGPPAHDQRDRYRCVGPVSAPRGLGRGRGIPAVPVALPRPRPRCPSRARSPWPAASRRRRLPRPQGADRGPDPGRQRRAEGRAWPTGPTSSSSTSRASPATPTSPITSSTSSPGRSKASTPTSACTCASATTGRGPSAGGRTRRCSRTSAGRRSNQLALEFASREMAEVDLLARVARDDGRGGRPGGRQEHLGRAARPGRRAAPDGPRGMSTRRGSRSRPTAASRRRPGTSRWPRRGRWSRASGWSARRCGRADGGPTYLFGAVRGRDRAAGVAHVDLDVGRSRFFLRWILTGVDSFFSLRTSPVFLSMTFMSFSTITSRFDLDRLLRLAVRLDADGALGGLRLGRVALVAATGENHGRGRSPAASVSRESVASQGHGSRPRSVITNRFRSGTTKHVS